MNAAILYVARIQARVTIVAVYDNYTCTGSDFIHASCFFSECREGSETAISLPTTLGSFVDPGLNTATSQETSDTARDFTNGDYSFQFEVWCAGSDDTSPSVTVFFSSPVLVTALLSGGRNTQAGSLYYVNNFTLEFYNDALDDFMYYNGSECDGPKVMRYPLHVKRALYLRFMSILAFFPISLFRSS